MILVLLWAIWVFLLGTVLVGTYLTVKHLKTPPPHLDAPFGLYPVSILKPLKGVDVELNQNLESFFQLQYPRYEIIFTVADSFDPALEIAQRLIKKYPSHHAKILIGNPTSSHRLLNPKLDNLKTAYQCAAHDWILISDSNIRVQSDYLKRMVAHLEPKVGIVTSLVQGIQEKGLGGRLEATYLNTFYTRGMVLAASVDQPCVIGKSMLFDRRQAERFGGIETLSLYLAEDYMAGEAMRALGLKVIIASDAVTQVVGQHTLGAFWARHLRWGRIRKAHHKLAFLGEFINNAFVGGLLVATTGSAIIVALHFLLWFICDALIMKTLKTERRLNPVDWIIREFLALPLWIHVALGSSVKWRGQELTLCEGGLLESPQP